VAEPGVAPSQWGAQGRSAEAEGRASMGPNHYEYLSSRVHKATADYKALSESLEKQLQRATQDIRTTGEGKKGTRTTEESSTLKGHLCRLDKAVLRNRREESLFAR